MELEAHKGVDDRKRRRGRRMRRKKKKNLDKLTGELFKKHNCFKDFACLFL